MNNFNKMDENKRMKLLKDIAGIDWNKLEEEYKTKYQERTSLNKKIKELNTKLIQFDNLAPLEGYTELDELEKEREEIRKYNKVIEDVQQEIKDSKNIIGGYNRSNKSTLNQIERNQEKIESLEKEIQDLKAESLGFEKEIENNIKRIEEKELEISKLEEKASIPLKDESYIKDAISNTIKQKALEEKYKQKEELVKDIDWENACLKILNEDMEDLKKQKLDMISNAKFPIEGLGFSQKDVTYNGIEFSEISMAQKIKVSMSMAMAMNPKIKVIRIMNGSLLDSDSMQEIERLAKENNFQVWIERIADKKSSNAVYIEDGEVV